MDETIPPKATIAPLLRFLIAVLLLLVGGFCVGFAHAYIAAALPSWRFFLSVLMLVYVLFTINFYIKRCWALDKYTGMIALGLIFIYCVSCIVTLVKFSAVSPATYAGAHMHFVTTETEAISSIPDDLY